MLRATLNDSLKAAMLDKDQAAVSTIRLIMAALKDRDICERSKGNHDGLGEEQILQMLQSMVKQRNESIKMYEQGGRLELAESEAQEIKVIQRFLPEQMSPEATQEAITVIIDELGVSGLRGMGQVMGALKERFAGKMDFAKASAMVKEALSG